VLVALTACGGAVESSSPIPDHDTTTSREAPSALGLWVAPTTEPPGYLPLDLCADGTVSYDFPADPWGVRERCDAIGGSHHEGAARVSFVVGRTHLEATLEDGQLMLAQPEGARAYYRTSRATELSGTYSLRTVVSHGEGMGAVTIERRFSFAHGRFTFDNVLSGERTGDRWSTIEQGSYAMSSAGEVVFTTDGEASHVEHVVVFGNRREYLHIGRIGYMARATQD
jgi:hypothetical protein